MSEMITAAKIKRAVDDLESELSDKPGLQAANMCEALQGFQRIQQSAPLYERLATLLNRRAG